MADASKQALFEAARAATERSHSPYSRFPVGAAIRTADGRIFSGANIEVVSYPEGWCAETTAISHMVMAGAADGDAPIAELAVFAPGKACCTPCGGCRQRLAEFGSGSTRIYLCDEGGVVEETTLGALFPRGFEAETLLEKPGARAAGESNDE